MAKPKGAMNKVTHVPGPPKKTRQGQGLRSLANHNRKQTRGQGK
jgi:hypothetical protein